MSSRLDWRSIFYVTLPVCAAALVLTYTALGESAEPQGRRLDLPGQALAITRLGGLAFAAIEGSHWGWTSPVNLVIGGTASSESGVKFAWRNSTVLPVPVSLM